MLAVSLLTAELVREVKLGLWNGCNTEFCEGITSVAGDRGRVEREDRDGASELGEESGVRGGTEGRSRPRAEWVTRRVRAGRGAEVGVERNEEPRPLTHCEGGGASGVRPRCKRPGSRARAAADSPSKGGVDACAFKKSWNSLSAARTALGCAISRSALSVSLAFHHFS